MSDEVMKAKTAHNSEFIYFVGMITFILPFFPLEIVCKINVASDMQYTPEVFSFWYNNLLNVNRSFTDAFFEIEIQIQKVRD